MSIEISQKSQRWRQKPWFGATCYLVLGVLWITGSDALLAWLISDTQTLSQYQSYKGYFYVGLTACLAWWLLQKKQHYASSLDAVEYTSRQKLAFLAEYDALTQLPNRQQFMQLVQQAIDNTAAAEQCAVLLLDLDNFKDINDSYGHSAGDTLLRIVSQRLLRCCHSGAVLARLGGDEFGVLVPKVASVGQLQQLTDAVLQQLLVPCSLGNGQDVTSSASIGISLYPQHANDSEGLLRSADAAMYKVKQAGRNHVAYYSDELTAQARQRVLLEGRLRLALQQNKLQCYYQPQLDLASGELVGAEVLLRWHDAELGFISPAQFIPLAESCGLIHSLGHWVLQQSCKQFAQWRAQGLAPFSLAVNVSAQQFARPQLLAELSQILADTGMPAHCLELEVTESALLLDESRVVALMQQIKALGVRLAIDDFGTGYSSLSYLKRLPLDILKIDRGFIEHIPQANDDKQIASAIIALAHNLNFKVLAEGVETAEQLTFLRQQGCDYYQGYYFSKPLPADDFASLLQQHQQTDNA